MPQDAKADQQVLYAFCAFVRTGQGIHSRGLYQKLEIGNEVWVVKNIYGSQGQKDVTVKDLQMNCIFCEDEKVDIVALPCRHLILGLNCAKKFKDICKTRECPLCKMSTSV